MILTSSIPDKTRKLIKEFDEWIEDETKRKMESIVNPETSTELLKYIGGYLSCMHSVNYKLLKINETLNS